MGLRLKNFNIMGVHEKPIYSGKLPKKDGGAERVCRFRGGAYHKRGGLCF